MQIGMICRTLNFSYSDVLNMTPEELSIFTEVSKKIIEAENKAKK